MSALVVRRLPFEGPLCAGRFVRRWKRFFVDVETDDGHVLTVHNPNTGSMRGCLVPGAAVRFSTSANPARRLAHTLELLRLGKTWLAVNTQRPNRVVAHFVAAQALPELAGWQAVRREVAYGRRSRVDLLLEGPGRPPCYVEIKNVTMRAGVHACFPDSPSERGRRHLEELGRVAARGQGAVILFFVSRADVSRFRPASEVDPAYARALARAAGRGVRVLAYRFETGPRGFRPLGILPVDY